MKKQFFRKCRLGFLTGIVILLVAACSSEPANKEKDYEITVGTESIQRRPFD